ncbi:YceI family protein [Tropicimonas sp. S265A]|uniref:YceI family protein n=1 Tax=Tropicimonas sp. S265A TaxID=3415134 RepID=UPI003C7B78A1
MTGRAARYLYLPVMTLCRALLVLVLVLLPFRLVAEPQSYIIDPAQTEIGFRYVVGGLESSGTMPLRSAALSIDFRQLGNTRIAVTLDASQARTVLPLAESALKGASVLDTAQYPDIRFQSTRVSPDGTRARVTGALTIRGQTRPISLTARFFRLPDRAPEDLRSLVIILEGQLNRSAFGASGFSDLVEDTVDLRIQATINRSK